MVVTMNITALWNVLEYKAPHHKRESSSTLILYI